jgi:hypothetical protein
MKGLFDSTQAILKFALLILGLIPTAAVLTGIIDIPPSLQQLLGLVTAVVGIGTVVLVLLLQDKLQSLSRATLGTLLAACLLVGCGTAAFYYEFAKSHVADYRGDMLVLPLHWPAELTRIVNQGYGGDVEAALNNSNRGRYLHQLIEAHNGSSTFVFVLLLVLSQFLIVFGLFGALVRVARSQVLEPEITDAPTPPATGHPLP